MTQLLIFEKDPPAQEQAATRFGGLPLVPGSVAWPTCKTCNGAMQFLGQLLVLSGNESAGHNLLSLFMCQNDPGMCDEWDPNNGGNCVLCFPGNSEMHLLPAPDNKTACRTIVHGAAIDHISGVGYTEANEERMARDPSTHILGQLFGEPDWIQNDETPKCDACERPMRFVAQLEEGPNLPPGYDTNMNFGGGGCAYVFDCNCGAHSAKMLWQQ